MKWHTEQRRISDLVPTKHNPRILTKKQYEDLRKSLEKFDLAEIPAINANTNQILAGHMRLKVLATLGRGEETIDVRVPDRELTPPECDEYLIRSNKNTGEWDKDTLADVFGEDFLKECGFTDEELGIGGKVTPGLTDPDDTPPVPVKAKTQKGDLWLLGEHRLLCGDSADHDDVARVLGGDLATCVFTDPPYGVSIGKKNRMLNSFQKSGRNLTDIKDDELDPAELEQRLAPAFAELRNTVMAEDATLFVTFPLSGELGLMIMQMMKAAGLPQRHVLIWKKNSPTFSMGRLDYDYQHEPIILTWGKRHKRPMGGAHRTTVWEIDKPKASKEHPTMKPVELYVNAYLNNSDVGDVVFDPYCGSGTCLIAAEQTGRKGRGIEISPNYCDVIIERWAAFTGQEPVREDGMKWSEVNAPVVAPAA